MAAWQELFVFSLAACGCRAWCQEQVPLPEGPGLRWSLLGR